MKLNDYAVRARLRSVQRCQCPVVTVMVRGPKRRTVRGGVGRIRRRRSKVPSSSLSVYRSRRPQAIGYGARSRVSGNGFLRSAGQALGRTLKEEGLAMAGDTLAAMRDGQSLKSAATGALKRAGKRQLGKVTKLIKSRFSDKKSSKKTGSVVKKGKKKPRKRTTKSIKGGRRALPPAGFRKLKL